MGHIKTIGLGTLSGAVANIVSLAAGIITVPLLLRALGVDAYGILGIVSSVVGFVGVADLGLTSTITNAVSYAYAKRDHGQANKLVSGGLLLYTPVIFGIILIAAAVLYSPWISLHTLLKIPEDSVDLARLVLVVMLSYTMASAFWGGVLKSLYHGVNEVAVFNSIQTLYNTLFAIAFIIYLLYGPVTLLGVAVIQAIGAFVRLALLYGYARKRYAWFEVLPSIESMRTVRPLLNYTAILFLSTICIVILERSDNLVLSHYIGPAAVAVYSIVYKLFYLPAAMLPIATSSVPTVAAYYAAHDKAGLSMLYHQILRVNILLKFTVFAILVVFSKEIVSVWVGESLYVGYGTAAVLAVNYLLFAWNGTHSLFFTAMQKFNIELHANVVSIIVNIAASIYLVQKIGILGVAVGTGLSLLLVNAWYLPRKLAREIAIHPVREARAMIIRVIPLFAVLFVAHYLLREALWYSIWFYVGAAGVSILFALAVFVVAFGRGEKQFIIAMMRGRMQSVAGRFMRRGEV